MHRFAIKSGFAKKEQVKKTEEGEEAEFKCGDCDKPFVSRKALAGHKKHCKTDSTLKKEPPTKRERIRTRSGSRTN